MSKAKRFNLTADQPQTKDAKSRVMTQARSANSPSSSVDETSSEEAESSSEEESEYEDEVEQMSDVSHKTSIPGAVMVVDLFSRQYHKGL